MNKRLVNYISFMALGFLVFCLSACGWLKQKEEDNYKQTYKNLYLINVNDEKLFKDARIKGSINITLDELNEKAKKLDKTAELIVYCTNYACTESDRVAKALKKLDFEKVLIYRGGIQEWYQLSLEDSKNYPFEGPATQKFLKRPIEKIEAESEIPVISAQDLSKKLIKKRNNNLFNVTSGISKKKKKKMKKKISR